MYKLDGLQGYSWETPPKANDFVTFCEDLHRMGYTGEGVVVPVVDSGVNTNDPDIMTRVISGTNISGTDAMTDLHDYVGHGGLVTKLISIIAPDAKFHVVKVFGRAAECTDEIAAQGIDMASDFGHVANASLGGDYHPLMEAAVNRFEANGRTLVVAAGNSSTDNGTATTAEPQYPGAFDYPITVGAVDRGGLADSTYDWLPLKPATYSSSYPQTDCVAVGRIPRTWDSGTSFAAPIITGLIALYISYCQATGRPCTDADRYAWLINICRQLPGLPARNDQTGYGFASLRPYNPERKIEVNLSTLETTLDNQPVNLSAAGLENRAPGGIYGWLRPIFEAAGKRVEWDSSRNVAKYYI